MGKFRPILRQWTGLNTKGLEDGRRGSESVNLQNARLRQGAIKRRPGFVRSDVAGTDAKAMSFNGTTQYVTAPSDSRVWALGTQFTIRMIFDADVITGTRPLLVPGITTNSLNISIVASELVLKVWDSDDTLSTISTTGGAAPTGITTLFITRDADNVTAAYVDASGATGSIGGDSQMSATKSLRAPVGATEYARDGTNFYDGTIDSIDVFRRVVPTNVDRMLRWPDPSLDPSCVLSVDFNATTDGIVKDLSRFRNHGRAQNSPSEVTALAYHFAPAWNLTPYRSRDRQRLLVHAGALGHIVEVT